MVSFLLLLILLLLHYFFSINLSTVYCGVELFPPLSLFMGLQIPVFLKEL